MNITVLRKFAASARLMLTDAAAKCAAESGTYSPQEISAAACTWFIRLTALRFMEINGYLPDNVQPLADAPLTGSAAQEQAFRSQIYALLDALRPSLPELFGQNDSLADRLFPAVLLHPEGLIAHMRRDIPEAEWRGQVQTVGWLYQYYNAEPKDSAFADLKRNLKISAEALPAATQIFTPDWIVRYMAQNTLGRLWAETNGLPANADWQYYINASAQTDIIQKDIPPRSPESLRVIDPCMGAGHILVYLFDLLMQLYIACGRPAAEAVHSILTRNLYGLDIDRRAWQLACFALRMKAREYDPGALRTAPPLNLACFADAAGVRNAQLPEMLRPFAAQFAHAAVFGSLLRPAAPDTQTAQMIAALPEPSLRRRLAAMQQLSEILNLRYDAVCTNPPYMANSGMMPALADFIRREYTDYRSDLFSAFTVRCAELAKPSGLIGLLTPYVWMFIHSYEKLRRRIYSEMTLESLIQLEYSAFEEATVPVCTFVLRNSRTGKPGCYIRLTDFRGGMELQRQKVLEAIANRQCGYYYETGTDSFSGIPGCPVAYWVSPALTRAFRHPTVGMLAKPRQGLATGCNERFVRMWYEVPFDSIGFGMHSTDEAAASGKRWFPYNKGGEFRKWYGNQAYVVNWEDNGAAIRSFRNANGKLRSRPQNMQYYFRESVSWSLVSSAKASFRYKPPGQIFDVAGMSCFTDDLLCYLLGFANSQPAARLLSVLAPTINFQAGDIADLPVIVRKSEQAEIERLVRENIRLSKADWDAFEVSWDFERHPLLRGTGRLRDAFAQWAQECDARFAALKANEEALNRIFIGIYGLGAELSPAVSARDITVRRADLQREVRSLISYAVGCLFGRYSPGRGGICDTGGQNDSGNVQKVLPLTGSNDLTAQLTAFFADVFGAETCTENLRFIAEALGGTGSPCEIIRHWLRSGFYADHCKIYRRRPIYWMLSSGRNGGFQALVYAHSFGASVLGEVLSVHLPAAAAALRAEHDALTAQLRQADAAAQRRLRKKLTHCAAQRTELETYAETLRQLADSAPELNPIDGIRAKYEQFSAVFRPVK